MARTGKSAIDLIIGENLARIRKARGLSQSSIAEVLDITFQQVQKYEKGTNRVSASVLFELAQALSVPMDDFFHGAEPTIRNDALRRSRRAPPLSGELSAVKSAAVKKALLGLIREVSAEPDEDDPSRTNGRSH
ncbi:MULTISPECIES: helix-turn-helix transcriptional regulator [unclassified Rhizobium]|uniref:helix-turn-helix domain-containing protein n=1 Tax=unclassified Rhizobium TaxID=2613769 RepID=UPI0013AF87B1|nr:MULTISPECIES: helix-turn-helix transcriptional regulator [unclassified Rhizobium]MBB3444031.1 transcriptional regulator with XRE-family HTH domain [Rhizobium sp. BK379]MBB3565166.1 transcriptional regulator with XRE-family HTH domain [Rhizobium sp. BK512]HEX2655889.1 helix-turn-helix transcriptional regulator [Xanthobacteraceae bacterium]